jgi:hypothetical protein
MKRLEKKIYREIICQASDEIPDHGIIDVSDPFNSDDMRWVKTFGNDVKIYLYMARRDDGSRIGVCNLKAGMKSVPNCSFSFSTISSFIDFIAINKITTKFPVNKKEEVKDGELQKG